MKICCKECGGRSDERAKGWRAFLACDLREDEQPFVVTFCPDCAEREFGPLSKAHR
jgi:hypothetical protein